MSIVDTYTSRAWRSLQPAVINQIGAILPIAGLTAAEARLPIAVIDRGGPLQSFRATARFHETGWTIVVGRGGEVDITAPREMVAAWDRAGGDPVRQDAVRGWWRRYLRISLVHEMTARLLTDEAELSWLEEVHRHALERLDGGITSDDTPSSPRPGARF